MKTASYCPRPAAAMRCFNLLSDGRTSKAGGSAITAQISDNSLIKMKASLLSKPMMYNSSRFHIKGKFYSAHRDSI